MTGRGPARPPPAVPRAGGEKARKPQRAGRALRYVASPLLGVSVTLDDRGAPTAMGGSRIIAPGVRRRDGGEPGLRAFLFGVVAEPGRRSLGRPELRGRGRLGHCRGSDGGTATWRGAAAGVWATVDSSGGRITGARSGEFTAEAVLRANFFGALDAGAVEGEIGSFRDGSGRSLAGWQVTLNSARLTPGSDSFAGGTGGRSVPTRAGQAAGRGGSTAATGRRTTRVVPTRFSGESVGGGDGLHSPGQGTQSSGGRTGFDYGSLDLNVFRPRQGTIPDVSVAGSRFRPWSARWPPTSCQVQDDSRVPICSACSTAIGRFGEQTSTRASSGTASRRGDTGDRTFRRGPFLLFPLTAGGMRSRLRRLERHRRLAREAELGAVPPHPVEHQADPLGQGDGCALPAAAHRQSQRPGLQPVRGAAMQHHRGRLIERRRPPW